MSCFLYWFIHKFLNPDNHIHVSSQKSIKFLSYEWTIKNVKKTHTKRNIMSFIKYHRVMMTLQFLSLLFFFIWYLKITVLFIRDIETNGSVEIIILNEILYNGFVKNNEWTYRNDFMFICDCIYTLFQSSDWNFYGYIEQSI